MPRSTRVRLQSDLAQSRNEASVTAASYVVTSYRRHLLVRPMIQAKSPVGSETGLFVQSCCVKLHSVGAEATIPQLQEGRCGVAVDRGRRDSLLAHRGGTS